MALSKEDSAISVSRISAVRVTKEEKCSAKVAVVEIGLACIASLAVVGIASAVPRRLLQRDHSRGLDCARATSENRLSKVRDNHRM